MTETEIAGLIEFLRSAERLKTVTRSAFTSEGHAKALPSTWRVALMATLLAHTPDVDAARLVRMCLVTTSAKRSADIPAPEQARRRAQGASEGNRRRAARPAHSPQSALPQPLRDDITSLWDEYERHNRPKQDWPRRSTSWRRSSSTRRGGITRPIRFTSRALHT
jgi:putative hydrolase of HD superfamily